MKLRDLCFKAFTFVFLSFLMVSLCYAQSNEEWTLQFEKDGVKLYSIAQNCDGKKMLFLKFENSNNVESHVSFNIIVESTERNIPLRPQSLELKSGATKKGDCESTDGLSVDIKNITDFNLRVVMRVSKK